jgi:hypothetical protein
MESPTSTASRPDFYDFLDRMRRPVAADLFRSIKRSVTCNPPRAPAWTRTHARTPPEKS